MCLFFALLLLAPNAVARWHDYFPLQVGNQWQYRCSLNCASDETATVSVVGTAPIAAADGSPYYILRGFLKDYWVRVIGGTHLVVARDPTGSDEEKLWYDFSAPENQEYPTSVHPCNVSARITSRNYAYSGPLGDFEALRIEYPATTCNLQGLDEEIFLPGIGLARRVDLSPGNRTFDLVFARVAGRDFTPASEISFGLALDRVVYSIGLPGTSPVITARVTLKNTTPDTLHLTFPANPSDLEIRNDQGQTVYLWSAGKFFPQVVSELDVAGQQTWVMVVPLETDFAHALPPGAYTAEGRLNTAKPRMYSATVSFQIQWVR
jgi:hypothetical protein